MEHTFDPTAPGSASVFKNLIAVQNIGKCVGVINTDQLRTGAQATMHQAECYRFKNT